MKNRIHFSQMYRVQSLYPPMVKNYSSNRFWEVTTSNPLTTSNSSHCHVDSISTRIIIKLFSHPPFNPSSPCHFHLYVNFQSLFLRTFIFRANIRPKKIEKTYFFCMNSLTQEFKLQVLFTYGKFRKNWSDKELDAQS